MEVSLAGHPTSTTPLLGRKMSRSVHSCSKRMSTRKRAETHEIHGCMVADGCAWYLYIYTHFLYIHIHICLSNEPAGVNIMKVSLVECCSKRAAIIMLGLRKLLPKQVATTRCRNTGCVCIRTYIHAYMHTCIHACIHAYMHSYIHYIH